MTPDVLLRIIELSLQITLEVIKGIPVESRQALWLEHEKRLTFWTNLFAKTQP